MIQAPDTDRIMLGAAQRLLTLADRDSFSPTFGCFDRDYWHYKTLRDFPSAIYQQAILPLAMLYRTPFRGNILAHEPRVLELIIAGMRYWTRIQRRSGAFDEWYPGEHSQVTTAFTSYAVGETLRILTAPGQGSVPLENFDRILRGLRRAGDFLAANPDEWVANHRAAAVAALETLYQLTDLARYRDAARGELASLLARQDPEGWFPEYNSADPAYLGITCAWLARYHMLSQDQRAKEALDRALTFLSYFLGPGGVFSGPIGVRDGVYLPLTGPLLTPPDCPAARPLAARCLAALRDGQLPSPDSVDDRYLTFFFAPDVVQSLLLGTDPGPAPEAPPHARHLPRAGLLSIRTPLLHLMVGLAKGGTFYLGSVTEDRPLLWDAGWQALDMNGDVWSSSWPGSSQVFALTMDVQGESSVEIDGPFHRMNYSRPLEQYLIPFRIFTSLFGDAEPIMAPFSRWVKGPRLLASHKGPLRLRRIIRLSGEEFTVHDRLTTDVPTITSLRWGGPLAARHSPTAKIFSPGELKAVDAPPALLQQMVKQLVDTGETRVMMRLSLSGSGPISLGYHLES